MTTIIRPPQFNRGSVIDRGRGRFEVRGADRPSSDGDQPLGPFLEAWLADVVRRSVRPKTFVSYRSIVRTHLIPALGAIPIADLRPADVQDYLNAKAGSGLAPRTVSYHRNILRQALGHAERTELVTRNVAKLAVPPRIPRREIHPLGASDR